MTTHARLEQIKHYAEAVTGIGRPKQRVLPSLIRPRKPNLHHFKDDGQTPNNALPLVHYKSPLNLDPDFDPAGVIERLFAFNGWRHSWRDGIYPFNHFHTRTHEVLGIARGAASVRFGGKSGSDIALRAGDVVVIPAGVGHRRLRGSGDLLVVGAYPVFGKYDEPRPREVKIDEARASIARVKLPFNDPVYGKGGPLLEVWRASLRC